MTFSVVARCPRTGQLGVGVSTAAFAAGQRVPHVRMHVGAIASQARSNPYLGIWGLQLLEAGEAPENALARVLAADPGREHRQVEMVDRSGHTSVFTGGEVPDWKGSRIGDGYVVAGNTLVGEVVVAAMAEAMDTTDNPEYSLDERLMRCLEAGQKAGGDRRGRQSAALVAVWDEAYPYVDLRVDDHPTPVAELRRLLTIEDDRRRTRPRPPVSIRDLLPDRIALPAEHY